MKDKSSCELRKLIRKHLEDACYIASVIAGYDGATYPHPWGKGIVAFIEETESAILRKMEYRPTKQQTTLPSNQLRKQS